MKTNKVNLGKVCVTIDKDYWDINKDYDKLVIVEVENAYATYMSRQPVPHGTDIENKEYWCLFSKYNKNYLANEGVFNVSKYLKIKDIVSNVVPLTLAEAVVACPSVAKNAGQIITFINSNKEWQRYQYQGYTVADWNNLLKWKNLNDSSSTPIEEGAQIYNISEYIPGGAKYGQLIEAGVYTIGGDVTPVSQYRTVFDWDPDLGEVLNPEKKDTSLVIKEIDTDGVSAYEYYVFVGNDSDGYGYQASLLSTEDDIPEWIDKAFGNTNDSILVNINKLKKEIDRTKISKGGLKTIQGKSIEGTGNIDIDTYINQFASSNNPINWNWGGDGNIGTVDIDNVKGVKASYSEEYETGNVYSVLDVTLKARQHYLFSFYLSGEGECDLSLSNLWDNVYVREFYNPIIIDGDEYIEFDNWKSHLKFTSIGYHYISFYADTNGTVQIDFEFDTNNNIIFYKPLFVACNPKSTVSWFANDEDIFTTKEQFGIAFKGVAYNSTTKKIEFTCVDNTKKYLDATGFVKDGMVSNVAIVNGNLVITFNTDSGKETIRIALTDIFNPNNYYTKIQADNLLGNKVDKEQGKGLSTNDYTTVEKTKLNDLPTATELTQNLGSKANVADLANVATSGSYNDLSDKPTIQDLATVKHIYALDNTNPDYPSIMGGSYLDKTSVFGTISIVTLFSDGTEQGLTDIDPESYSKAQYTIDNTTYTSYYYNSKYYLGIRVPFFTANVAHYGNDYTFGVIKFTSTHNGVFKVHAIGVTQSNCNITVNGVTTASLDPNIVAVQVNAGDVVKVITTTTTEDYHVRIIGFVLEGVCGVSLFVNDAGYITASDVVDKQDKMPIVQVASGTTAINAAVNTYYEVAGEVGTLAITLPTPTDLTKMSMVVVHLTAGTTPNIIIGSTETIDYSSAYDISASKEYEINCMYNGDKWVVADMEVV